MDWLKIAVKLVDLGRGIVDLIGEHQQRGAGFNLATLTALQTAQAEIVKAKRELEYAEELHAHDSSDAAFDRRDRRDD